MKVHVKFEINTYRITFKCEGDLTLHEDELQSVYNSSNEVVKKHSLQLCATSVLWDIFPESRSIAINEITILEEEGNNELVEGPGS